MALPVTSFPILSFAQANPALAGAEEGQNIIKQGIENQYLGPLSQQELLKSQLANELSKIQNQYAAPSAQANLDLTRAQVGRVGVENSLTQAQTGLTNQQSQYLPYEHLGNVDPLTKLILDRQLVKLSGASPSSSISPNTNNSTVVNNTPVNPLDALYSQMYRNQMSTMLADPTKSNQMAGGTFTDPFTGQRFTTDTRANTSMDQQTSAAIQRSKPLLDRLSDNLSQFQTISGRAGLLGSQLKNFVLGGNSEQANKYAQGQSDLDIIPEGLIRAWGLKVTNEAQKTLRDAVTPRFGESPEGYKSRIVNTLEDLQRNQAQAEGRLDYGLPLNMQSQINKNITSDNNLSIPKFSSKAEFSSWYKSLTPDQKSQFKNQLGGR